MSEVVTVEQPATPAPIKSAREPRVTKCIAQAIELLETGECTTQKAACARVGISEQHLSRSLKKVHIQAFIARRRSENITRAGLRASYRLGQLVDAKSEQVSLRATERVLETTGDLKSSGSGGISVNINNNMSAGYVIDLGPAERAEHIDHTPSDVGTARGRTE